MSNKKRQTRKKLKHILVSVLVLAAFIIPAYLSVLWLAGTFGIRDDSRKVVEAAPLQTRNIDKTSSPIRPFDEPLVSVTFDDGWESVYTKAFPVLQQDGIKTTQYIITDIFGNEHYMSAAQLHSLQEAGHDIASHTVSHADLTTLNDTQLTHELKDSQSALQKDFDGSIQDFTSPYGSYNQYTLQTIGKYYRSQKNAEGDPDANELEAINVKATFNPLNIKSYSVRNTTSLDDIKKLIKAAQENNGWLVLTYHQVDYSNETFSVTPENFQKQMQLISSTQVRIPTLGKVLDVLLPNTDVGY